MSALDDPDFRLNWYPRLYREGMGVEEAYQICGDIARRHYENFTVVSRITPPDKRDHVGALYAFCRYTDDLGDELEENNLKALDLWEEELDLCFREDERPGNAILIALSETVRRLDLPPSPFRKLIEANRIDQRKETYEDYDEVLHYCDHSANPVGRLFLMIFGYRNKEMFRLSDSTCTGLQLANFWQDVDRDERAGRIYIPQEDMVRFDYSPQLLRSRVYNEEFVRLMEFQVDRTKGLLKEGLDLPPLLGGRLEVAVELFNRGGLAVLDKIEELRYDVLHERPTLSAWEKGAIALSSLANVYLGGRR